MTSELTSTSSVATSAITEPNATSRLRFSSWSTSDLSIARLLWGEAQVVAFVSKGPWSEKALGKALKAEVASQEANAVQNWPVFLKDSAENQESAFVGVCGLRLHPPDPEHKDDKVFELTCHLRPQFWRQGYATEACKAVLHYAFTIAKATAVHAGHHQDNVAARKLLEKLGFAFTQEMPYPPLNSTSRCYLLTQSRYLRQQAQQQAAAAAAARQLTTGATSPSPASPSAIPPPASLPSPSPSPATTVETTTNAEAAVRTDSVNEEKLHAALKAERQETDGADDIKAPSADENKRPSGELDTTVHSSTAASEQPTGLGRPKSIVLDRARSLTAGKVTPPSASTPVSSLPSPSMVLSNDKTVSSQTRGTDDKPPTTERVVSYQEKPDLSGRRNSASPAPSSGRKTIHVKPVPALQPQPLSPAAGPPKVTKKKTAWQTESMSIVHLQNRAKMLQGNALFCFSPESKFRQRCYDLSFSHYFRYFMLGVIVLNFIQLAFDDPGASPESVGGNLLDKVIEVTNYIFVILFTLECVIKSVALGFYFNGPNSYLKSAWHKIDFLIVLFGYIAFIPMPGVNAAGLRALRVFSALKAVSALTGMRIMVASVIHALKHLRDVGLFLLFTVHMFGIVFLHFYSGSMRQRCYYADGPEVHEEVTYNNTVHDSLCSMAVASGRRCDAGQYCAFSEQSVGYGVTSYDNIVLAWMNIIVCLSQEGWTDQMYMISDSVSKYNTLVFILLILIGSSFTLHLITGVLFVQFETAKKNEEAEEQRQNDEWARQQQREEEQKQAAGLVVSLPVQSLPGDKSNASQNQKEQAQQSKEQSKDQLDVVEANGGEKTGPQLKITPPHESAESIASTQASLSPEVALSVAPSPLGNGNTKASLATYEPSKRAVTEKVPPALAKSPKAVVEEAEEEEEPTWGDRLAARCFARVPFFGKINRAALAVVNHSRFSVLITTTIALNTLILMLYHYGMSDNLRDTLDGLNLFFTLIFFIEMLLKLAALGPVGYCRDVANLYDAVVTLGTFAQLMDKSGTGLAALQALRVLRIFKVLRSWKSFNRLLTAITGTVTDLTYFGLVMFLFMFMFAIAGRAIFSGQMAFCEGGSADGEQCDITAEQDPGVCGSCVRSRNHFDTFGWSLMTTFQVMTPENWNAVLTDAIRAVGWGGGAFIVVLFLAGNYVVLNLFLAILLSNFDNDEDEEAEGPMVALPGAAAANGAAKDGNKDNADNKDKDGEPKEKSQAGAVSPPYTSRTRGFAGKRSSSMRVSRGYCARLMTWLLPKKIQPMRQEPLEYPDLEAPFIIHHEDPPFFQRTTAALTPEELAAKNLSPVRYVCARIVNSKIFENVMVLVILISCVLLALDEPPEPGVPMNPSRRKMFANAEYFFIAIFSLEFLVKITAMGFRGPDGYFRQVWNVVDLIVLACSIMAIAADKNPELEQWSHGLRALRALRPLRIISTFEDTRAVLGALILSFKSILQTVLFGFVIFLIMAIIGVAFFSGKLGRCYQPQIPSDACPYASPSMPCLEPLSGIGKAGCIGPGQYWRDPVDMPNFDNVGAGLLFLFELSTQENWPYFAYMAVDATGVDQAAEVDHNPQAAIFFVLAIAVAAFFYSNLFVGAIVDAYEQNYHSFSSGKMGISEAQRKWLRIYRNMADNAPNFFLEKPKMPMRLKQDDKYAARMNNLLHSHGQKEQEINPPRSAAYRDEKEAVTPPAITRMDSLPDPSFEHKRNDAQGIETLTLPGHVNDHDEQQQPANITPRPQAQAGRGNVRQVPPSPRERGPARVLTALQGTPFQGHTVVFERGSGGFVRREQDSLAFMDKTGCCRSMRRVLNCTYDETACCSPGARTAYYKFRMAVYDFVVHPWFNRFMIFVVVLNTIALSAMFYDEPGYWDETLDIINDICSVIYMLECILKITGYGFQQYFGRWENFLHFVVAIASAADFFGNSLELFDTDAPGWNPKVVRVVRVIHFARVLDLHKGLVELVSTLRFSLPGVYHITFLLVIVYFMYAIGAMALFGHIHQGNFIDRFGNFNTFFTAMITLFRMTTGESWNGIMRDCMLQEPYCPPYQCGSRTQAIVYWVSFIIISNYLLMNIFIAVVLRNFEDEKDETDAEFDASLPISNKDIQSFAKTWMHTSRSETMRVSQLDDFLTELTYITRHAFTADIYKASKATESSEAIFYLINTLGIPMNPIKQSVHYVDVFYCLAQRKFRMEVPELEDTFPLNNEHVAQAGRYIKRKFPSLAQSTYVAIDPSAQMPDFLREFHEQTDKERLATPGRPLTAQPTTAEKNKTHKQLREFAKNNLFKNPLPLGEDLYAHPEEPEMQEKLTARGVPL